MFNGLGKTLTRTAAVIGAAAVLALTGHAQAAQYVGKWDPAFGSAFPDLGWRGEATFFVPDACLVNEGFMWNSGDCSGMKLVNAEVEFYKVSDPTDATLETLSFATSSSLVLGMTISDGVLAGVLGTFGYYVDSALPLAGGPNTEFNLSFLNDIAVLDFKTWGPCHHFRSYSYDDNRCVIKRGVSDRIAEDGEPFITFTAVPEPTSGALILLALGTLAAFARRRSFSTPV